MTIIFDNLTKIYNGKIIFNNISGRINKGDKTGIIGKNGIGKTTLVRILMGLEEKDEGDISFMPSGINFSYLNQNNIFNDDTTVFEEISLHHKNPVDSSFNNSKYFNRLKKKLWEIGFSESYYDIPVKNLSGGEKTRLAICKMLLEDSDVMVFDEPTNHLDIETIKWLEEFLRGVKKTIIIVSHDRLFLDNTVNKILEMREHCLRGYKGNYSDYKAQREIEFRNQQATYEKQQNEIMHLKEIINERKNWYESAHKAAGQNDFLRSKAKKHVNVIKAKEKSLERLEANKVERPKSEMAAAFDIINKAQSNDKLPEYLIKVTSLCKSFGSNEIFKDVSFNIKRNDKIALIGRNGSGKTTLIKMLLEHENSNIGEIYKNPALKIGYFSQELEALNDDNTILDETLKSESYIPQQHARLLLGCLFFKGEDVYKRIKNLSMGQKCRVAFAKLILSGADMLMLDEPTNYMDIVSREKIEEALENYDGTLLFVSHDRYFIKRVATRVFEIQGKKVIQYEGDFDYYLNKKNDNKISCNIKDYSAIKNEISRLECEIAFISGKLNNIKITTEEKLDLDKRFIVTAKKLRELKNSIRS